MKKGTLKQILLMTDGCSNKGEDPVATAALAYQQGIIVNVIGILDDDTTEDPAGLSEIKDIASAGGGISQLTYRQVLSQTVQTVTQQAMTQTLQGYVNNELKQILGDKGSMDDLDPDKRGEIMEVIEDLGETSDLELLVLVDTSASMRDKLPVVKEALVDLSASLNARIGRNRFCIYRFPGKRKDMQKLMDWSPTLESATSLFPKLSSGGITPTGPAIRAAIYQFSKKRLLKSLEHDGKWQVDETGN